MQAADVDKFSAIPLNRYSVVFNDMESHYNALLGTVPGVVYTLDEKGHFTYVSSSAESVLGYSLNELIGRHFSCIIYPDDIYMVSREHILPKFAGVPTGVDKSPKLFDERRSITRKTSGLNVRLRSRNNAAQIEGNSILEERVLNCKVNSSGQYINKDGQQKFCGTVGFIFDVAHDNSMIPAIESRKRYNALDLLSHALAHAFSNVFTGIYGNLQLMEMQLEDGNQLNKNIDAIKHSVESAVSLIKQVTQSLNEPSTKNVSDFLQGLVTDIATESFQKTGQVFECTATEDCWEIDVDPDYVSHILRSVFYHLSYVAQRHTLINGLITNVDDVSDDFPRLDCKYIKIALLFSLSQRDKKGSHTVLEGNTKAMGKIASMALNYTLIKKVGGVIQVSGDGDGAHISIYLPSKQKADPLV